MFALAILIGIYSYLIFFLGIFNLLYKEYIVIAIILILLVSMYVYRKSFVESFTAFSYPKKKRSLQRAVSRIAKNKLSVLLLFLLFFQIIINLIGALGPEHAFDALWYHLTIPKLFLINHKVFYIPGGLLYYSVMPKMIDMLFVASLGFGDEILAKLVHFSFGLLTLVALYKLARMYFPKVILLMILVALYANLVLAWESITAYIDLGRMFYEVMTMWAFVLWMKRKEKQWFYLSALMCGFAISTKHLAMGSLIIFVLLFLWIDVRSNKGFSFKTVKDGLSYVGISFFVPLPYFIFAYINTGNPVFPFFGGYDVTPTQAILSPLTFVTDFVKLFLFADDPISPIYIISIPLVVLLFNRFRFEGKLFLYYSIGALLLWYVTPRTGGGRFVLPYLPIFSLVIGEVFYLIQKNKQLFRTLVILIVIISSLSIFYRGYANKRYLPVILGRETKDEFLKKNLHFNFGDFYDIDGYFAENISCDDTVLLYGFHNLYYVNFPFIDNSWIKKGDTFTHIATQHTDLPDRFKNVTRVYENKTTGVTVYSTRSHRHETY